MGKAKGFERAEFTEARKADYRSRWLVFLFVLLFLSVTYWIARDIVYHRLIYKYAQNLYNDLGSAAVEKIGSVTVDGQGDVTLHDAEAYTHRTGKRRIFFKTERLVLSLDGMPLRDERLRVMRVDLFRPEIYVRREWGGEWNVEWAFLPAPRGPEDPEPAPDPKDPWKDYLQPDSTFPRNGVHVHDGTIHVTFIGKTGKEVTWDIEHVQTKLAKSDGRITLRPFTGEFYGGKMTADAEIPKTTPFTVRQLTADIRDADVAKLAAGATWITHPMKGRLNGVLALTRDAERTQQSRPVMSGHVEITDGDLWEMPAFSSIIHILTLTPVSEKRIDTAIVDFTVDNDSEVRVDKMHFLGYPVSLFGDGAISLTGDWMEIVFVPRLGKSDWNSILPIIGAPIDLLTSIFKGAVTPVVLSGSFDKPDLSVRPFHFLKPSVRKLIEEKSPQ